MINRNTKLQMLSLACPIPCVRVSSAQASGKAGQYPYWGAVRYEIRLRKKDGIPILFPLERASSDRRSNQLAWDDAYDIADEENRLVVKGTVGELSNVDLHEALNFIINEKKEND